MEQQQTEQKDTPIKFRPTNQNLLDNNKYRVIKKDHLVKLLKMQNKKP